MPCVGQAAGTDHTDVGVACQTVHCGLLRPEQLHAGAGGKLILREALGRPVFTASQFSAEGPKLRIGPVRGVYSFFFFASLVHTSIGE